MQLTSEKRVIKAGNWVWVKKISSERNEALDCLNYALICFNWYLAKLGSHPFRKLREFNAIQKEKINKPEEQVNKEESSTVTSTKRKTVRHSRNKGFFK